MAGEIESHSVPQCSCNRKKRVVLSAGETHPTGISNEGSLWAVAKKLGVDPSYLSRVARDERHSAKITAELEREVTKILSAMTKTRQPRR